jgi:hypothetical protein
LNQGGPSGPPFFVAFLLAIAQTTLPHNRPMLELRRFALLTFTALASQVALPALAQDGVKPVYRCPGPPVLYTDALSAAEAREKNCRTIEGAPITIVQAPPKPKPATTATVAPAASNGAANRPGEKVDPAAQRARDTDARRILGDELKREEERLAALVKDYNGGEPERRGDERNFQKYADRVADMKAAIARKEADVAALKRELAKLPQ